jgi:hypothetical protein
MIKFNCPYCKQIIEAPDETVNENQIVCPHCQRPFNPQIFFAPKTFPAAASLPSVEDIEFRAKLFSRLALLFLIPGMIAAIVGMLSAFQVLFVPGAWVFAGYCLGAATWFYLIAQIIHIRALLARRA